MSDCLHKSPRSLPYGVSKVSGMSPVPFGDTVSPVSNVSSPFRGRDTETHPAPAAKTAHAEALFVRRGLTPAHAAALVESLVCRDQDGDDRRLCVECGHLAGTSASGHTCNAWRKAGAMRHLPTDLVVQLQRCPAFTAGAAGTPSGAAA